MRGRKPVPTTLRQLHGNPRKVALPKFEPKPIGDLTEAPDWLSEGQRQSWDYAMAHSPPGLLKRIDAGALVAWVVAEDLHRRAAMAQAKVGLLLRVKGKAAGDKDEAGVSTASPYINIINQQAKILLKAASDLGFTPVSRPRIFAAAASPGAGFSPGVVPAVEAPTPGGNHPQRSLADYLASAPPRGAIN